MPTPPPPGHRPIHERVGDLLRARNARLSAIRMVMERESEARGENFSPNINPRSAAIAGRAQARSRSASPGRPDGGYDDFGGYDGGSDRRAPASPRSGSASPSPRLGRLGPDGRLDARLDDARGRSVPRDQAGGASGGGGVGRRSASVGPAVAARQGRWVLT
jgi:hypothetical protein